MPSARILVVEDYEAFRRFITSTLETRPDLQVVGIVSDGLAAVQQAEELQPDLILLDIGLPKINGIEAARRIREVCRRSKIIFLTQEPSADVAQEALNLGAKGYVVKANAGSELLPAIAALLQGEKFLSKGLSGRFSTDVAEHRVPERLGYRAHSAPLASRIRHSPRGHAVQFYADDASLVVGFTLFIETALETGNAVAVIATESHLQTILQRLEADGVDVVGAIDERRYIPLDVDETLSTFMVKDKPDPVRFQKAVSNLFYAAKGEKGEDRRVAACGETAPTAWAEGKAEAAVQIEHLWDEMSRLHDVDTLCGYVLNEFQLEQQGHIYDRICAEHSTVL